MDTLLPLVLTLSSLVVYPRGGSHTYTGLLKAQTGFTRLVWAELPPTTIGGTVRVSVPPTARGYIVQTAIEPYSPAWQGEPPDLKQLRREIDSLESLVQRLQQRIATLSLQESVLTENRRLGGEEGTVLPEQVEKYLALIERHLARILEERAPLQKKQIALQDTLLRWKKRYENRRAGLAQERSALYITYWSPQKEVLPLRVELMTQGAAWNLRYRVRALPASEKVLIQRWAAVQNLSGEDWQNVPLTLSTAQPGQRGEMPPFTPWYVDLAAAVPGGRFRYLKMEAAAAEASAEGDAEAPQEPEAAPPLPAIQEQTLSRTYELGPQTVPAGGRQTQFFLREDTLSAVFQFFINAPAEPAAYLRAALIAESFGLWEPAQAAVEVEGQEVASITWPPALSEDTVWLDLGRSSRIQVKRTEVLNKRETRLTGGTVHHQFAYTLRLTHTYPTPTRITVWDRIPVSRTSDIKVELVEAAGAVLDKEKGQLRWDLTLNPGEVWERTFRFTVKYPKGKSVSGL